MDTSFWRCHPKPARRGRVSRRPHRERSAVDAGLRFLATSVQNVSRHLRAFADERLTVDDYERAAEHFNSCRARGVQGSNTNFLICAAAERRGFPILTTDDDFVRFAEVLPIAIHGR